MSNFIKVLPEVNPSTIIILKALFDEGIKTFSRRLVYKPPTERVDGVS
jgi:hypothetical protein